MNSHLFATFGRCGAVVLADGVTVDDCSTCGE